MATRTVYTATRRSIKAMGDQLGPMDAGAVAALLELARQIDAKSDEGDDGKVDNVTIPTYLRYCESLGLTPAGRVKLKPKEQETGGKLAQLRSIASTRSA
jgi:hypothetical protein